MYVVEKLLRNEEQHEAFVYCAGQRFRITLVDCERLAIEEGATLTEEIYEQLVAAEARLACIQKAFSFLSYGDLSKKRLIEKLRRKFDKALCEQTADLLEERGYLNDLQLAKRYADNYYEIRSYGPMRIKQELYGKGFCADVIEQALEPYISDDHREKILELLEKKFSREALADTTVRRKASAWLNRNGYSWSEISDAMNELY